MSTVPCNVSEDEILAYCAGDLDGEAELAIARHLADCDLCRDDAIVFTLLRDDLARDAATAIRWHAFATPFGTMFVAASDRGLVRLSWNLPDADAFEDELRRRFPGRPLLHDPGAAHLADAERQLREYFAGRRTRFDLPVDLDALPAFDRRVLEAARQIPFGTTVHYGDLARRIDHPRAARAVGNALGRNPVAIVVPCHRVVRSDGSLGGYGIGGITYKQKLLELEAGRRVG